jgi:hypothetical protein
MIWVRIAHAIKTVNNSSRVKAFLENWKIRPLFRSSEIAAAKEILWDPESTTRERNLARAYLAQDITVELLFSRQITVAENSDNCSENAHKPQEGSSF